MSITDIKIKQSHSSILLSRLKVCGENDVFADNLSAMLGYVVEEVGEAAEALRVESGNKDKVLTESFTEELLDVAIAAIGTYFSAGGKVEDIATHFDKKITKWESRI